MKIQEFRDQSPVELSLRRTNMKHEMMNLRIQQKGGVLENTARIKTLRRAIAKIETVLTSHKAAAAAK